MKRIIAIPGSLREKSFNKSVCKYLCSLSNQEVNVSVFELNNIPLFNADLESNLPTSVQVLVNKLSDAEAIIIATPEYNNMIPGVLKNTLDWLSRSYAKASIRNKPLAIVGASDGGFGTVRAQNQLLLLATLLGFKVDAKLRFPISHADQKFNSEGERADEQVKLGLKTVLDGLIEQI